jgi:MoaA/NifB/PqqE/SkfB family radical SAM enzyme
MSAASRDPRFFQRSPTVRLRREAWGGLAFDRSTGDLLELDAEGFAVLAALGTSRTLPALARVLRERGTAVRLPELARFIAGLEGRGFVRQAGPEDAALPPERWADGSVAGAGGGLRAPVTVHWAVTYRCNLECPFCYAESHPGREAGPGPEVRLRLVERLAAWCVLEVALGGGEPTVLPDFPELLAALRASGMVPNVTTNGTIRHERTLAALAAHAGVVHLSADRPELLDAARGPGVFERVRATAGALVRAGVRLGVNLLLTPDNVATLSESLAALLDLGVQGVTFLRPKGEWAAAHWPGFPSAADLEVLAGELRAFLAGRPPLRLHVDTALRQEWADLGFLADPEPEVLGCGGAQRHVALTPDGDLYPCSHARLPEYRLGNLLEDEPERLWSATPSRQRYLAACAGTRCACRTRTGGNRTLPVLASRDRVSGS